MITLTETNISSHDVGGVRPEHRRLLHHTQRGPCLDFETRVRCPVPPVETLKPGQSFTLQAVWDGTSNVGPPTEPTGVFVVHNALIPNGPTATFIILPK